MDKIEGIDWRAEQDRFMAVALQADDGGGPRFL